ncbi:hypothetical protein J2TS6_42620 [Paenibacillus albilobatus]|uniref:Phage tail protein n=1 Tax=Paenibacillus albilobatus TaxID=2716884 RepID=A0A919XJ27_9BACL|nr:phage tail protein [Paenibacillus albilobatus]GIO33121.1 hypothetical protein J2TS6_42620 [Paenibacillus albilobatus]
MSNSLGGLREARANLRRLESTIPRAVNAAINRAGQMVKTEATRQVRETYTVKAKSVNEQIQIRRSSPSTLSLRLSSKGGNLPLIRFKTSPSKPPAKQPRVLKAEVKKGVRKPIKGAFVTQVGGHVGVLKRVGRARLPIKELYGPAVPVMLDNEEIRDKLEQVARRSLEDRLEHEMRRLTGGST